MSTAVHDPFDSAVADAESASHYFGRMMTDAQFVILKKGQPKQVWTEGMDTDGRTTEVSFRLNPLDITGMTRMVERQVISNSGEWSRIVWPSLRDLGCKTPRDIEGQWAHVEMVPSGRKYTNKEGQEIIATTLKFIKLFALESDCVKAWEELVGNDAANQAHTSAAGASNGSVSQSAPNDAEKAAAAQFLPHIVAANKHDLTALASALASMSPLNKYFTVTSPEVQQLLQAAQC